MIVKLMPIRKLLSIITFLSEKEKAKRLLFAWPSIIFWPDAARRRRGYGLLLWPRITTCLQPEI